MMMEHVVTCKMMFWDCEHLRSIGRRIGYACLWHLGKSSARNNCHSVDFFGCELSYRKCICNLS
jgi:hypothetical protein